jgi:DNA polymerase III epsilon subunit-like protein
VIDLHSNKWQDLSMDGFLLRYNKSVKYTILDIESFNLFLNFAHNRPWQIGILNVRGETIKNFLDIHINWPDAPHLKISAEAAIITRFNQKEHDKLAIAPEEAFYKFWNYLVDCDYLIMHNGLKFDLFLLKDYAEMMKVDWKFLVNKIIDTNAIAKGIKLGIPYNSKDGSFIEYQYRMANTYAKGVKTNLKALGKEYGIEHDYENLHDALQDISLNLKVWNKIKYQVEI